MGAFACGGNDGSGADLAVVERRATPAALCDVPPATRRDDLQQRAAAAVVALTRERGRNTELVRRLQQMHADMVSCNNACTKLIPPPLPHAHVVLYAAIL